MLFGLTYLAKLPFFAFSKTRFAFLTKPYYSI